MTRFLLVLAALTLAASAQAQTPVYNGFFELAAFDSSAVPLTAGGDTFFGRTYAYTAQAGDRIEVTASSRGLLFQAEIQGPDGFASVYERPWVSVLPDESGVYGATIVDTVLPVAGTYSILVAPTEPGAMGSGVVSVATERAPTWTGGGDPSDRYALLVGVSNYPGGSDTANDLVGPELDIARMRDALVNDYGYKPENVVTLVNGQATGRNIVSAFRGHLSQAGPYGAALFYFSGHGTQWADVSSDEADGTDEALVLAGEGGKSSIIRDDVLGQLFAELKTTRALAILDNCHAGTGTRGVDQAMRTGLHAGLPAPSTPSVRAVAWENIAASAEMVQPDPTGEPDPGPAGHGLLAAGQSSQIAWEALLPDRDQRGGIFTFYLLETLRESGSDASLRSVVERMQPYVFGASRFKVHPQHKRPLRKHEVQSPVAEGTTVDLPASVFFPRTP